MALKVFRMKRSEVALGVELCTVVDFSAMLLSVRVYLHACVVHEINSARNASQQRKLFEVLATPFATRPTHICRLFPALKRNRNELRLV